MHHEVEREINHKAKGKRHHEVEGGVKDEMEWKGKTKLKG
jgi:hypothetical protein